MLHQQIDLETAEREAWALRRQRLGLCDAKEGSRTTGVFGFWPAWMNGFPSKRHWGSEWAMRTSFETPAGW